MQATLGKKLVGIKVVDVDGQRTTFGRATGRHLVRLFFIFILYIGFLTAAFTQKKQTIPDVIAD